MALVGEAKIKVVADTSKVRSEIQKAFNGMESDADKAGSNVSKSFNKGMASGMGNGKGFSKFQKQSMAMSSEFHKAIRSSYKWQAAAGALAQSLMALGGGLLALAGNIAGAASAGVALVGVMAQIKVASMVAKSAFKGIMAAVKKDSANAGKAAKTIKELREEMQQLAFAAERAALSEEAASIKLEKAREDLARVSNLPPDNRARREAQLAYSEAELAYRMAKDKNADAQDALLNPKKKGNAQDPYKDLTKSQKEFAYYLKGVMPEFKKLNEAAAKGFLPEVKNGMEEMFKGGLFNRLVKGFGDVGKGLGKATKNFAGTLFDPQNQNNLSAFFKNAGTTTGTLGTVLGKVFSGFLTLMRAINPLVTRFTSFLETKSTNFAKSMQGDFGNVQKFFKDAGDAAAGWGQILGRIWGKFKGLIKANVGPGTGGQLLLDYLKGGADGFRGLDGAAGEFARKNHFLASATNLKAMLESIGRIFSFMSDLGTSPAVASFWNILAELEGPLSEIFDSIQGSSDELARMLVTIAEIIASFADADQLQTYMAVLESVLSTMGGILMMLQPLFKTLGPLIGVLGALVTTFYLLKNVTMLVYGTYMIFTKAINLVNIAMKTKRVIDMSVLAVEKAKNLAAAKGVTLTGAQTMAIMRESVANRMAAITKAANAAGNVGLGVTSAAATGPVAALGVAVMTATWPLVLIVAAIAAVIAVIVIMIGHFNAVKADKIKKANKEIQDSFKDTKGEIIGTTDAQRQWTAALSAVDGEVNPAIKDIKDVGNAFRNYEAEVKRLVGRGWSRTSAEASAAVSTGYTQAKEALHLYTNSLKTLVKKDLPEAQRQYRNMAVAGNLTRDSVIEAIKDSKGYTKELEKQANAMGDTILKADGTVDSMKALDYAIGEGSYLRQKAILEQQKLTETFKNAANSFLDSNDAMQKATTNGKTSLGKYSAEMKKQTDALTAWRGNISKISTQFKDKKLVNDLIAQGQAGAGLVATLAEGGQKAVDQYEKVQRSMLKAKQDAENYTKAFSSTAAILKVYKEEWNFAGPTGESKVRAFQADIEKGLGVFELAAKYKIDESSILAAQRKIDSGQDLANTVNLTAKWDKEALEAAGKELADGLGTVTLTASPGPKELDPIKKNVTSKDGGLIARFANGWGPNYNGRVSGPGTGRSDQIPAMISNGEFVVNARATAANLDLLNAINNNKNAGAAGSPIAITVNAAPGMDEQQVAAQVAAQLNAQLSRGGSL